MFSALQRTTYAHNIVYRLCERLQQVPDVPIQAMPWVVSTHISFERMPDDIHYSCPFLVYCSQHHLCRKCVVPSGAGANPISPTVQYAIATDECPECLSGSLDLAQNGDGRWTIDWYPVQCNVGSSNFQYSFASGCSATYVKMAITNTRSAFCLSQVCITLLLQEVHCCN